MLRWAPYPFIRIALSLIAGILVYFAWGKDFHYSLEVFAFFVALYLAAFLYARRARTYHATDLAGLLGLLCFVSLGFWATHLHTPANSAAHITYLPQQPSYYTGVVADYVVQKPGYQQTVLEVQQVQVDRVWQPAEGRVQLSLPHDGALAYEVGYGDVLLVKGPPQPVPPAANPNQFDYRAYLANKGIYHRHYLQPFQFQKIGAAPPNALVYASIQLRRNLDQLLRERVQERQAYAISSALILGVKDDLDNAIRNAYASTGTMHVLAVSGLHVGLIYLVLNWLLGRFAPSRRQRVVKAVLVLSFLWTYAFLTGLSPSVLRAVVMFSMVAVADAIRRQTNIYNTIAIAATGLLLLNPYNLKEVGFQLSFLAVLGIVYLQPKFYKLLEVDNYALDKVWMWFTVSVAAQLATLPLGLFYFHQFPVYFWFANLVVVPAATLVLYTGLSALALSWVPGVSWLLFWAHGCLIGGMNWFNLWVQRLPFAVLNGIDITGVQTWLLYLLLSLVLLFLALRKLRYFALATAVVAVLSAQAIGEELEQQEQMLLTVYNVRGSTGMALVQGQHATVLADSLLLREEQNYTYNLQPHLWHLGISQPQITDIAVPFPDNNGLAHTVLPDSNSLLVWHGKRMLFLSHPPKLQAQQTLPLDYLFVRRNVRLWPRDLQRYAAKKVILDASNSPWYRERLHQQLDTLGITYYDVADSGAFVVRLR
ncbi:competence protein ComEC family protein [Pontibacter sp. E15-1]|uniref:ComEC/Rec2 family competence protein n=1 Tax=Pontibacter sp. E15-1 TaxID=2919918 RepID=UPI001F4FE04C|nr:ComEC/Rec2 family competence protein [Pontibacter sp. E15-1]MCJ8164679.1 competence protein ComEC family protein [Pontibacter sp. E15-1]